MWGISFVFEKRRRVEKESFQDELSTLAPPRPPALARFRSGCRRTAEGRLEVSRESAESKEQGRWLSKLRDLLEETDAPALNCVSRWGDNLRAVKLIVGGRRAITLRARVRAWALYLRRLRAHVGCSRPAEPNHVTDYLQEFLEKPFGRSVLKAAWVAMKYAQDVFGWPAESQLTQVG